MVLVCSPEKPKKEDYRETKGYDCFLCGGEKTTHDVKIKIEQKLLSTISFWSRSDMETVL